MCTNALEERSYNCSSAHTARGDGSDQISCGTIQSMRFGLGNEAIVPLNPGKKVELGRKAESYLCQQLEAASQHGIHTAHAGEVQLGGQLLLAHA